jgi:hypothetical protein
MYIYADKTLGAIGEATVTKRVGDLTENFSLSEFASRGTPVPEQYLSNVKRLAQNLQVLRNHLGKPIQINSAYRSPAHNASVNGATNSQHLTAKAADITVKGLTPSEVYCAIETLIVQGKMQQGGLGLYPTFVHYDVRDQKARWKGSGVVVPDCGVSATQPTSTLNLDKAVSQNNYWSQKLGWSKHLGSIMKLVGYVPFPFPDLKKFAEAIARWQDSQGLRPVDGIIGHHTWLQMQRLLRITPAPLSSTTSIDTSNIPQSPFGTLTILAPANYRFSYTFTPKDAMWLARLIVGEAGGYDNPDNHAVIWAIFNRFGLFTHAGSYWMKKMGKVGYKTLAEYVQSYSTTLQPVLHNVKAAMRAIDMSKKQPHRFQYIETGGFYPGTTIPKGQLKHHREHIQKMTWNNLKPETQQVVEKALKGQISSPIGIASEFANTYTYFKQNHEGTPPKNKEEWQRYTEQYAKSKKWTWVGEIPNLHQVRANAFFIDNRVKNLPLDTVRVIPPM